MGSRRNDVLFVVSLNLQLLNHLLT
jgi:hypothetical protein